MLTIENYKKIEGGTFWTNSNTQEWTIGRIEQTAYNYQIVVLPKDDDTNTFSIGGAIVYTLKRTKKNRRGYKMINSKNDRVALVTESNLTFDNFILELLIQTALNTN